MCSMALRAIASASVTRSTARTYGVNAFRARGMLIAALFCGDAGTSAVLSRSYASKSKSSKHKLPKHTASPLADEESPVTTVVTSKGKEKDELIPGARDADGDIVKFELEKVGRKMTAVVDRFKKEVAQMETRGSGRVTASYLDPVRVEMPGENRTVRLEEVATVGVREGSTLIVTLFDEGLMKPVERALNSDRLGLTAQRVDARTLRIPIPRPTAETRTNLLKNCAKQAEEMRVQVRAAREAGNKALKTAGHAKNTSPLERVQKLTDTYIEEIDGILQIAKKTLG